MDVTLSRFPSMVHKLDSSVACVVLNIIFVHAEGIGLI